MALEGAAAAELLSFLIADIRGYTSFTQSRGDEAAAELAGKFARIAREGIEAHDGRLLELRGDEALAVFTSARASLRAAVALQEVFADETRLDPGFPLTVGIGLDAGEVVPVEGGYRGGALNLAARLCSLAKAGEALASEGVTHLARAVDGVTVTEWGTAEVKGLVEPVRAFTVTFSDGVGPVPELVTLSAVPAALDSAVPMIGRDVELRQLSWVWRTARRRRGQMALVRGPSGIGKTRLLSAVAEVAVRGGGAARFFSMAAADPDLEGLRKTLAAETPLLVAVDDADAGAQLVVDVLSEVGLLSGRPVLVVLALDDEQATDEDLRAVRGLTAGVNVALRPLDPESVRAVAALYLDSADAVSEVPSGLLESTGGVPRRVHQTVASWAEDRATRRMGVLASQAAGSRSEVAVVESALAGTVGDLQRVRERSRLYGLGPGRHGASPEESPYKGLDSFGPEDAEAFFGRERLVADLVARVAGGGLVGVVGPSGSGKSSLVRAGLIPAVTAGVLPGSQGWVTVVMRPGEHPIQALNVALLPVLPGRVASELTGTAPLLAQLSGLIHAPHILLAVDQAEELFTVCTDDAERADFVDGLIAAAGEPSGRIDVVLTVRADYYGRFAGDQRLASAIAANQVLVGPMTSEEYRRAITRPAQRHGVTVEPELVDALVDEVSGQPGALPLLSTALLELWEARTDRTMTLTSYRATGGLHGAVARLAESVYTSLDLEQQQCARRVFLRLTGPGAGDTVVKRRVRLADLAVDEESSALVDLLAPRRLLTIDDGAVEVAHEALLREWPRFQDWLEEDREGIRLRAHLADAATGWEADGRDDGELYRGARLSATLDWTTAHAQDLSPVEQEFVTASSTEHQRATAHQQGQNRRLRGLLAGAAVFLFLALIAGVLAVRQANRADDQANRADDNAAEARSAAESARQAAVSADARRLGARAQLTDDISLSLLLAAAGARLADSPETRVNLLAALAKGPNLVRSVPTGGGALHTLEVSPDGRWIAAADNSSRLHLYDASTSRLPPIAGSGGGQSVVNPTAFTFTPDSSLLAVSLADRSTEPVRLLDPDTMQPSETRLGFPGTVPTSGLDVQVSADGRFLAASLQSFPSEEPSGEISPITVAIWDLRSPATPPVEVPIRGPYSALGLSPDGQTLYTAGPLTAYDVATGRRIWRRPDLTTFGSVEVNAQGTLLALQKTLKDAVLVDAATRETVTTLRGHRDEISNLRFSPDGSLLGTASHEGEFIVWDVATRRPLERWASFEQSWSIGFSPDNALVYAGGADAMLRTWDLSGENAYLQQTTQVGDSEEFAQADISPDGREVAYRWRDDTGTGWVRFVDTITGKATAPAQLPVFKGPRSAGTWHPDGGQYVAYGCDEPCEANGFLWLLDPATGDLVGQRDLVNADITSLAYVEGNRSLLVGDSAYQTNIVDAKTLSPRGQPVAVVASCCATAIEDGSMAIVFEDDADNAGNDLEHWRVILVNSGQTWWAGDLDWRAHTSVAAPDGSTVAVAGDTGEIATIDVSTGTQREGSTGLGVEVRWLNYSDDGELLVSGAADGGVSLWDATTLELLGTVYPPHDGEAVPAGAQFIGGTHDVAIASYDGSVYTWETDVGRAIDFACQMAGRNLTEAEWEKFLPEQPYRQVCPGL